LHVTRHIIVIAKVTNKEFVCAIKTNWFILTTLNAKFKKYEGPLESSWTHLITPSRNFVEVR